MKHVARIRTGLLCALVVLFTGVVFGEQEPSLPEADWNQVISLEFTDAPLRTVLETIGAAGNLQFVYDQKFYPLEKVSVSLSDVSVLDALRFVTRSSRMFHLVLESQTVYIAPDHRQQRQEHMPRGTRTFRLEHADPKTAITALRSLLQTRDLVLDERLNTVTMTDTFAQLDLAEEVIDRLDLESGPATDVSPVNRQPLWVGTPENQDMHSKGDPIPRLEPDTEQEVAFDSVETTLRQAYAALGDAVGIQFVFASKIDLGQPATFGIRKMSFREALDVVNQQFGHFSVVWGPRTIFIAPDSRGRRYAEEYLAIQFFYLSHAAPRDAVVVLRSQIQTRGIAEIPRLNAIAIVEKVAKLKIAQELIAELDRAD